MVFLVVEDRKHLIRQHKKEICQLKKAYEISSHKEKLAIVRKILCRKIAIKQLEESIKKNTSKTSPLDIFN